MLARLEPLLLLLPPALICAAAAALAFSFSDRYGFGSDPILPHLGFVAALVAALAGVSLALAPHVRSRRRLAGWLALLWLPWTLAAVGFWAAAHLAFEGFRDFPTRDLVVAHIGQLHFLASALPLPRGAVGLAAILLAGLAVALALLFGWASARGAHALVSGSKAPRGGFLALLIASGGAWVGASLAVQLEWYVARREPLMSSWHNVSLHAPSPERFVNTTEVLRDLQVERDYGAPQPGRTPNVILVYVDALRAEATQPYGAARPNMPWLTQAVGSGVFRQASVGLAACPATPCGIGALLQSRNAAEVDPRNFSLPRLLKRVGYRTAFVLSSDHQSYFGLRRYYGDDVDFYRDGRDLNPSRPSDDELVFEGLAQLGPATDRPTFLMIGLLSAHPLGYKHEKFRRYQPYRFPWGVELGPEFLEAYRNNYDNGVLQADDVLRRLWDWLSENGYLRDAVVIVTSDHGESLGEDDRIGHARGVTYAQLSIPFWLHDSAAPFPVIPLMRQIDVGPTVLSRMGLPVPATWRGVALDREPPAEWSEHAFPRGSDDRIIVRYLPPRVLVYRYEGASGRESFLVVPGQSDHGTKRPVDLSEDEANALRARLQSMQASPRQDRRENR